MPTLKPAVRKSQEPHVSVLVGRSGPEAACTVTFIDAVTSAFFGSMTWTSVGTAPPLGVSAVPPRFITLPTPQPGNGSLYGQAEFVKVVIVFVAPALAIWTCMGWPFA